MREKLIKWTSISLAAVTLFVAPVPLKAQSSDEDMSAAGGKPPGAQVVKGDADSADADNANRPLRQPPDLAGERDAAAQNPQETVQTGPEGGKQADKAARLSPLQQIRVCNQDLKKAADRLKRMKKTLGNWQNRIQTGAKAEGDAWSKVAREFIKSWLWRAGLLSENRERCETFDYEIAARSDLVVLTVRGELLRFANAKRKLDELASSVKGLRVEAQDLRPVPGGVCRVQVIPGCMAAENGMKRRSYATLEGIDVETLPDAGRCESLGETLREKRARGELHIPGESLDIWVNKDGDVALCSRDEGGWYVRDTYLQDFTGLLLKCGG